MLTDSRGENKVVHERKSKNVLQGSVMNTTNTVITTQTVTIVLTKLCQENGRLEGHVCVKAAWGGWDAILG